MKTIKQIADEIGISKDKVKYQVRKLPSNYLVKKGNSTYITDEGTLRLKAFLVGKATDDLLGKSGEFNHHEENELYKILRTELEAKNKQIDEQQQTINQLTETVKTQAQSINADRHNELAGTLQMQLTNSADTEPKSRWQRLKTAWKGDGKG